MDPDSCVITKGHRERQLYEQHVKVGHRTTTVTRAPLRERPRTSHQQLWEHGCRSVCQSARSICYCSRVPTSARQPAIPRSCLFLDNEGQRELCVTAQEKTTQMTNKNLRKAAEQGDAVAQSNLGYAYANEQGVPQDYAQAVAWFRKAADQGNANAQSNLGLAYAKGQGVPQDYAQAVAWWRKAADQGNAGAQKHLGNVYRDGQGVPQDSAQAVAWFRKAADQGDADAQVNLGHAYDNGESVPQDYAQAAAWFRKAADQGNTWAQFSLGLAYQFGKGVPQDAAQAETLMRPFVKPAELVRKFLRHIKRRSEHK